MAPEPRGLTRPNRPLSEFEEHLYEIAKSVERDDDEVGWDIDATALKLTFESASPSPAKISFTFTVAPKHCNKMGNLHGGCAATIIDHLSSVILLGISKPGLFSLGGVSRHLDVTYLRPLPEGTRARLVCRVVSTGKRLALIRSEILREEDGAVCVVSDHEKANTDEGRL
ncbi:HotDog domain-containing protein [Aspergillus egyptiacus]|nr:HotDog domain-containing protein [Aspergillus egyptiacus]